MMGLDHNMFFGHKMFLDHMESAGSPQELDGSLQDLDIFGRLFRINWGSARLGYIYLDNMMPLDQKMVPDYSILLGN